MIFYKILNTRPVFTYQKNPDSFESGFCFVSNVTDVGYYQSD